MMVPPNFQVRVAAGDSAEVFFRSVAIVGVAELFDKTWFMALLLALRYNLLTVFVGSFAALFVHTILAAAMGYAFASLLSVAALNFATALVMFVFTCMYAKDWYDADGEQDAIEAGKAEAANDTPCLESSEGLAAAVAADRDADGRVPAYGAATPAVKLGAMPRWRQDIAAFGKVFLAVFIAEWGDRTQIAMIGQHASQPLVPVFLGSLVAFFVLTLSAVGAAVLLQGQRISEKAIYGVSAFCFAIFTMLALHDGIVASRHKGLPAVLSQLLASLK